MESTAHYGQRQLPFSTETLLPSQIQLFRHKVLYISPINVPSNSFSQRMYQESQTGRGAEQVSGIQEVKTFNASRLVSFAATAHYHGSRMKPGPSTASLICSESRFGDYQRSVYLV